MDKNRELIQREQSQKKERPVQKQLDVKEFKVRIERYRLENNRLKDKIDDLEGRLREIERTPKKGEFSGNWVYVGAIMTIINILFLLCRGIFKKQMSA